MNIQVVLGNRESIRDSFINQKEEVMFFNENEANHPLAIMNFKEKVSPFQIKIMMEQHKCIGKI